MIHTYYLRCNFLAWLGKWLEWLEWPEWPEWPAEWRNGRKNGRMAEIGSKMIHTYYLRYTADDDDTDDDDMMTMFNLLIYLICHSQRLLLYLSYGFPPMYGLRNRWCFFCMRTRSFTRKVRDSAKLANQDKTWSPYAYGESPYAYGEGKKKIRIWGVPLRITNLCAYGE